MKYKIYNLFKFSDEIIKTHIDKNSQIVKVTTTSYYVLSKHSNNEEILHEWFVKFSPYQAHAYRDSSLLLQVFNNDAKVISGSELNIAIINGDKVIFSDNEACHTVHNIDEKVVGETTAQNILDSVEEDSKELTEFIRHFGERIERNYERLLESIKEIGLNPKDFKR